MIPYLSPEFVRGLLEYCNRPHAPSSQSMTRRSQPGPEPSGCRGAIQPTSGATETYGRHETSLIVARSETKLKTG